MQNYFQLFYTENLKKKNWSLTYRVVVHNELYGFQFH